MTVGTSIAQIFKGKAARFMETAPLSELVITALGKGVSISGLFFHAIDTAPKTRLRNSQ